MNVAWRRPMGVEGRVLPVGVGSLRDGRPRGLGVDGPGAWMCSSNVSEWMRYGKTVSQVVMTSTPGPPVHVSSSFSPLMRSSPASPLIVSPPSPP